ncbi:MAG: hypothetical protein K9L62_16510 [Vallitaleaceae bacterium]|nr:hypothetical protein [Vallitaleaceae bacterium]
MDREKLLTIRNYFRSHYDMGIQFGKFTSYTDEVFNMIITDIKQTFCEMDFNQDVLLEIKHLVDSEFQIFQPDGDALLNDYEHEHDWYAKAKDEIDHFYWPRYRSHLFQNGWTTNILSKLGTDTLDRLMNFLGDPNSPDVFSRKGLVMGDVQSGKTSNYIGLICKAVDAGYKVIILLTGTIESLRRQTQIRVEEGFIGYDVENREWVGVGLQNRNDSMIPKSATSRVNDFTGTAGETTFLHFNNEKTPFIFITKKNSNTLKKIRDTISNINIVPPAKTINTSLLIVDDEADNASINTNQIDYDPTVINQEIRKILNLFTKSNYVGFTATPFANVFIDPASETEMLKEDLFPKDFIFSLNPPNNYMGPQKIFSERTTNTLQIIDDYNDSFPLKHKKSWSGDTLFESLVEAIYTFMIVNSIRDINEGSEKNSHRSMMINVSRFIKVQERLEVLIGNKVENITNAVRQSHMLPKNEYIKNPYIKGLFDAYEKHYSAHHDWETVFAHLYSAINGIQVFKIPFKDKKKQLDYEKHIDTGLRAIIIGGLALSRGITLEGLTISYLYRNTSTFDVLMQMGRWFGYRNKPKDYSTLCKVWMLEQTKDFFLEITSSIIELKNDFKELIASKKTPQEFGIRVRNESDKLGITSRNKMRTTKKFVYTYDLYGQVLETPFLSSRTSDIRSNYDLVNNFITDIEMQRYGDSLFKSPVSMNVVVKLLSDLNIHEANRITYFQKEQIIDFIENAGFSKFDVVIISGKGPQSDFNNSNVRLIERSFDILDENTLRIGGVHRRLGGSEDTRFGLSKQQIIRIRGHKNVSNSTYMIEDRNPILILYPLSLKKTSSINDNPLPQVEIQHINRLVDEYNAEKITPIGIGIGFPKNRAKSGITEKVFYINDRTKWWNLMNRKDNEEDE